MVICPWCGTNYAEFQSNCKNCGGPIPYQPPVAPAPAARAEPALIPPPPAPRPISNSYARRLMLTDGGAIAGFILGIIGGIFTLVGAGLTFALVTAFVGIIFLPLGLLELGIGLYLLYWRYNEKKKIVEVLRNGQAIIGQITSVRENYSVSINDRHPWIIEYEFRPNGGLQVHGKVTTLNTPGPNLQTGCDTYVLYMPQAPSQNTLYPHP